MIEHDFSQLPVVDADFKPLGIVTTDSITRALLTLGTNVKELRVRDVFTKPPIFQADEDLLYLLDYLLKASAVFIVDAGGKLIGIITDYDTTQYFRQRAEDIVLVEDIESTLKSHLRAAHNALTEDSEELRAGVAALNTTLDETRKRSYSVLKEFCKNKGIEFTPDEANLVIDKSFPLSSKARPFDSLTLSEYIQFAQKAWSKLDIIFTLPKSAWLEMMDAVREIRNKLVHFRGDISPVERAKLRYCAEWYKMHQPSQKDNESISDSTIVISKQQTAPVAGEKPESDSAIDNKKGGRIFYNYGAIGKALNQQNKESGMPRTAYNVYLSTAERVLGMKLPTAAYEHITWWTDNPFRNRVWAREGWVVTSANLADPEPYATFRQIPLTPPPLPALPQAPISEENES
jgi:CBS domain-containing protein